MPCERSVVDFQPCGFVAADAKGSHRHIGGLADGERSRHSQQPPVGREPQVSGERAIVATGPPGDGDVRRHSCHQSVQQRRLCRQVVRRRDAADDDAVVGRRCLRVAAHGAIREECDRRQEAFPRPPRQVAGEVIVESRPAATARRLEEHRHLFALAGSEAVLHSHLHHDDRGYWPASACGRCPGRPGCP